MDGRQRESIGEPSESRSNEALERELFQGQAVRSSLLFLLGRPISRRVAAHQVMRPLGLETEREKFFGRICESKGRVGKEDNEKALVEVEGLLPVPSEWNELVSQLERQVRNKDTLATHLVAAKRPRRAPGLMISREAAQMRARIAPEATNTSTDEFAAADVVQDWMRATNEVVGVGLSAGMCLHQG